MLRGRVQDSHRASADAEYRLGRRLQSVPNMALYAASQAFVRNFSEGLHDEHCGTPLSVTCICLGGIETAFHAASGGGDYSWIANASTKSPEFVRRPSSVQCWLASTC